jgi:hypothetical protein
MVTGEDLLPTSVDKRLRGLGITLPAPAVAIGTHAQAIKRRPCKCLGFAWDETL